MRTKKDAEKERIAELVTTTARTAGALLEECLDEPVDVVLLAFLPDANACISIAMNVETRAKTTGLLRSLLAELEDEGGDDDGDD